MKKTEVGDQRSEVGEKTALGMATKIEWLIEAKRYQDLAVKALEVATIDDWSVTQAHGAAINAQTLLGRAIDIMEARQQQAKEAAP